MSFEISLRHRIGERDIALDLTSAAPLTALVGPSGAGKTTVLNCIAGLARPVAGRIAVSGETLFDSTAGTDLPPERRRAGYVFQDFRLFPHLKVAANLAYGERLARPEGRWIERDEVTGLLGIGHLLGRWPATLSGGEMRRVAIGRALLSGPRFLLLDEPFASLDAARAEALMQLVERIRDELAVPILLVSHDREEVERLAGEVAALAWLPA
jgi:molybdate transport system ATP-binding protein